MIKITIYIIGVTLCLNLKIMAQEIKVKDVALQNIHIGQKVPDEIITGLHNYQDENGKSSTTAKISNFKGKLLILDFWATWCSPCIAMIPKMDSLQFFFGNKIQFLPITYQSKTEVLSFLERLSKQHPYSNSFKAKNMMVFSDKTLHSLFPHSILPHYVFIGADGIVKAITGNNQINSKSIAALLNQKNENMKVKTDDLPSKYDRDSPFLINGNGGIGNNLIYHSVLTGYIPGLIAGSSIYPTSGIDSIKGKRIIIRNVPIPWFYRVAFGDDEFIEQSRLILAVKDTTRLVNRIAKSTDYENWKKQNNAFCYELIVPPTLGKRAYEIMRNDLDLLFNQYQAGFEKQKKKCLILVRTSSAGKFYPTGGIEELHFDATGCKMKNADIIILFRHLRRFFQNSGLPIINETGYTGKVDININANMTNISAINEELKKYDLQFIEAERDVDMLVIRDKFNVLLDKKQ